MGLGFNVKQGRRSLPFVGLNDGFRSKRFALVAQEGLVTHLAVDAGDALDVTSVEATLDFLESVGLERPQGWDSAAAPTRAQQDGLSEATTVLALAAVVYLVFFA